MRPVINVPKEERATDIGHMHKKLVKIARVVRWFRRYPGGQTDTQTDILVTILRNRSRGRSNDDCCQLVRRVRGVLLTLMEAARRRRRGHGVPVTRPGWRPAPFRVGPSRVTSFRSLHCAAPRQIYS